MNVSHIKRPSTHKAIAGTKLNQFFHHEMFIRSLYIDEDNCTIIELLKIQRCTVQWLFVEPSKVIQLNFEPIRKTDKFFGLDYFIVSAFGQMSIFFLGLIDRVQFYDAIVLNIYQIEKFTYIRALGIPERYTIKRHLHHALQSRGWCAQQHSVRLFRVDLFLEWKIGKNPKIKLNLI